MRQNEKVIQMRAKLTGNKLTRAKQLAHKQQIDNPGIDAFFHGQDELYWAVNEQVLQQIVDSGKKMDYSFSGLKSRDVQNEIAAISELATRRNQTKVANFFSGRFPFRMREVEFLITQGYTFEVDLSSQINHWLKP